LRKFFKGLIHNFRYKVSAVGLALIIWYIVQGEEILEINRRIIVTIEVPEGMTQKGSKTSVKDATLRGPRVLLGDFSTKPLEAVLRIPESKKGKPLRYRIDKEYIRNWDSRIRLTVHDAYLTVFVDEKFSKKVPVKEFLKGVPAEGFIIEKTSIKPQFVTVTGLKSEVSKIDEVLTSPIDVEGLQQSKSFEARLSSEFSEESLSETVATVFLQVGEKKINKEFRAIPIEVKGNEFLSALKPKTVSIKIQSTPGVLSFIRATDLEAFVEAGELAPGKKYVREIQVKIPPSTVLIETFPKNATLEIYNQKRLN
jgi:hypothetical protein